VVSARQATQPGGIGSLESILGLLKSLKIRAPDQTELSFKNGGVIWFYYAALPSMYKGDSVGKNLDTL